MSPLKKLAFHKSGKPRGWMRRILFDGRIPRAAFRLIVLKKSGRPRQAFRRWLEGKGPPARTAVAPGVFKTSSKAIANAQCEVERSDAPAGTGTDKSPAPVGIVSVVIPLYNHERYIAETVESALAQGPLLREVVVVDDGSSDESARVMRSLGAADRRVVFWSQPNRGAHAAINAGIHRATGDLVAILNSDDAFAEGRLNRLVAALRAEPNADMAASGLRFMDDEGFPVENPWHERALDFYRSCGDLALALVNGNFLITTSNFLLRRRLVDRVGLFAPLRYAHDLDFLLRVLARGGRIALVEERLLRYRIHAANTIKEQHSRVRLEWTAVAAFWLTNLWDRSNSGPIDWERAREIEDVLDRHGLTRGVHLCMAYFRRHPTDTLERSPFFRDNAFRSFLAEVVG